MSFLHTAFPVASALPLSEFSFASILAALRPVFGLGVMASLALIFKPLLTGLVRAAGMLLAPVKTREQKSALRHFRNTLAIRRVANEFDAISPSMAAELRAMAARG